MTESELIRLTVDGVQQAANLIGVEPAQPCKEVGRGRFRTDAYPLVEIGELIARAHCNVTGGNCHDR